MLINKVLMKKFHVYLWEDTCNVVPMGIPLPGGLRNKTLLAIMSQQKFVILALKVFRKIRTRSHRHFLTSRSSQINQEDSNSNLQKARWLSK